VSIFFEPLNAVRKKPWGIPGSEYEFRMTETTPLKLRNKVIATSSFADDYRNGASLQARDTCTNAACPRPASAFLRMNAPTTPTGSVNVSLDFSG
jgi:hypothetical protein